MARGTGSGFGHFPFGGFPFGHSDYGEDVVVRSFPVEYLEEDENHADLLKHYLYTIKDSVNRIRSDIDKVPDQMDVDAVRSDVLQYLGSTIDVVIDDSEPVEFQRSLVNSAVQFYRIKGTEKSYQIRGKISGYDVEVFNLWHIHSSYIPFFEDEVKFEIPIGSGEYYVTVPPGSRPGTPTEESCDYCLTSQIKLQFTLVKAQPPSSGGVNFFDRLVDKLRDIIPIHVREVLFELRIFIFVDEHQYLDAKVPLQTELTYTPTHFWYHFDAVPADIVPMDFHGTVTGTVETVP